MIRCLTSGRALISLTASNIGQAKGFFQKRQMEERRQTQVYSAVDRLFNLKPYRLTNKDLINNLPKRDGLSVETRKERNDLVDQEHT